MPEICFINQLQLCYSIKDTLVITIFSNILWNILPFLSVIKYTNIALDRKNYLHIANFNY